MIARSFDYEFLNKVVNHPQVFSHLSMGAEGPFDMAPLVMDPRNYFLAAQAGGFLVLDIGEGIYEVHSQFLPEGRGAATVEAAGAALKYMFTQTPCTALLTYCPRGNAAAVALARKAGFALKGRIERLGVPCKVYTLTREEYLCRLQSH